MTVFEQTLKGADYSVFMKIPTFMMDELCIENGDWMKLRIGTGYFALVKTNDKRSGVQVKDNKVRFPQKFSHIYRIRSNDRVQMYASGEKIVFSKIK